MFDNPFRNHPDLARLVGVRNAAALEDPLFLRPNPFHEFLAHRGMGHPGWGQADIFGHYGAEFDDLPNPLHVGGAGAPNPLAANESLFNNYLRNIQQNQANQNEGIGQ